MLLDHTDAFGAVPPLLVNKQELPELAIRAMARYRTLASEEASLWSTSLMIMYEFARRNLHTDATAVALAELLSSNYSQISVNEVTRICSVSERLTLRTLSEIMSHPVLGAHFDSREVLGPEDLGAALIRIYRGYFEPELPPASSVLEAARSGAEVSAVRSEDFVRLATEEFGGGR
jgi:hypothetical protein